jgi:microsomal epoxide hydrolase
MPNPYSTLPNKPTIQVDPFKVNIPQEDLDDLKVILKHTRIPKETFENSQSHPEDYGVTREWFIQAREKWLDFDWCVDVHFSKADDQAKSRNSDK